MVSSVEKYFLLCASNLSSTLRGTLPRSLFVLSRLLGHAALNSLTSSHERWLMINWPITINTATYLVNRHKYFLPIVHLHTFKSAWRINRLVVRIRVCWYTVTSTVLNSVSQPFVRLTHSWSRSQVKFDGSICVWWYPTHSSFRPNFIHAYTSPFIVPSWTRKRRRRPDLTRIQVVRWTFLEVKASLVFILYFNKTPSASFGYYLSDTNCFLKFWEVKLSRFAAVHILFTNCSTLCNSYLPPNFCITQHFTFTVIT